MAETLASRSRFPLRRRSGKLDGVIRAKLVIEGATAPVEQRLIQPFLPLKATRDLCQKAESGRKRFPAFDLRCHRPGYVRLVTGVGTAFAFVFHPVNFAVSDVICLEKWSLK